jgi:hypothetical protein
LSLLNRLFGKKPVKENAEIYKGFRIFVAPMRESPKYRLAARIEKDVDGATLAQQVIRADTFDDLEQANAVSLAKSKQIIDEQGDSLFRSQS